MNELIEIVPETLHEIHRRLEVHFMREGHFDEALEAAFRDAPKRITELATAIAIPEEKLVQLFWWMARSQSQEMRAAVIAVSGVPQKGWWRWRRVTDRFPCLRFSPTLNRGFRRR